MECVFGQLKRKFACLSKRPDYRPIEMVNIIKACCFLWNFGLLCGDNQGYNPDDYIIEDQEKLDEEIAASAGGRLVRDIIAKYLFEHKK